MGESHSFGAWVLLGYAGLVVAGGFVGWRKGGSRISFTSGLIAGALMTVAYRIAEYRPVRGYLMGTVFALLLGGVFYIRFRKTKKMMPTGLMLGVSALTAVTLVIAALLAS
ncbi:MAG: hypothetical protein A3F68_02285 [Acidobacteria bacterium RIFCSPLOWO2_12_FULL_54_10]|nr:MAG: hypothetical protein A3F68_02285 [Acidobacteria bacterium RIFCSPLOWO2_12_FULL_54_10]